ncbi:GMC oxidoreductase [Streptomyces spectabilis]|uniref:GMC oxidoreductase n=1 Tax=Streptomyces spectabilis TaxID=68270 RepID=UPI0033C52F66
MVDAWQHCWDHPGLYAVGCGSMPSIATSNPTLTTAALALRSAERVEADLAARDRPIPLAPSDPQELPHESAALAAGARALSTSLPLRGLAPPGRRLAGRSGARP